MCNQNIMFKQKSARVRGSDDSIFIPHIQEPVPLSQTYM